mmetsp:Transcript_60985/g.122252  ORF Transcript_60985/g.122252 Transcript_60985/m.122252 type:complete len:104 (+) Transcript_60985:159-470(+)
MAVDAVAVAGAVTAAGRGTMTMVAVRTADVALATNVTAVAAVAAVAGAVAGAVVDEAGHPVAVVVAGARTVDVASAVPAMAASVLRLLPLYGKVVDGFFWGVS